MDLNKINVIVDGYNLEMQQGTGIKTYATTLVNALISLGVNVDLLCSRHVTDRDNSLLVESMFFDDQKGEIDCSKLKLLKLFLKLYFNHIKEIPNTEFVIKQESDFIFSNLSASGKILNISGCYTLANSLYRLARLNTTVNVSRKIDVWHMTYPIPIKIKNAKTIATIHDLVPLKLPYTTLDDKKYFFNIVDSTIKKSDLILTVSESARQDILQCFDIDPEKVFLTYQPIINNSALIKEDSVSSVLDRYSLEFQKYILFVGAIEPKKNVGRLVEAYKGLDTDMKLVIVGKKAWLWKDTIDNIKNLFGKNFSKKVKILNYLPRKDLGYLYTGAFCFVFPSLYEGFGLPPLEAMSFNCPVITSKVSSLPEVCGDAAIYIDPYDSDDIREGIEKLINNPHVRSKLIESGKERLKIFSMENYKEKLYKAYTKII
ncbi:glycosyltransferase family 4 protein [Pseudanabaena sp. UWO310]|nr:glycosyltransferase family 4 protein [Pseudanabaena sp. UWO310]